MSHRISSDDLMALARATPENRNATLLRAATALFCQEAVHERDAIHRYEQLAVYFLPKVGESDRAYVATLLATRDDAPVAAVRMLARDVIGVAGPVLRQSPVLTPIDLLGVIAVTGPEHHRLIAVRSNLTDQVLWALRRAEDEANKSAIHAAAAPIALEFDTIASDLDGDGDDVPSVMGEPLAALDFLELPGTERLRLLGSIATKAGTTERAAPPIPRVERALRQAYAAADVVVRAKTGDHDGLVRSFAEILDLDVGIVLRLVNDPSGEPLVLLIKAAKLSESDGRTVLLLANPEIGKSVDRFFRLADLLASLDQTVADRCVAAWRGESTTAPKPAQYVPLFADVAPRRGSSNLLPASKPSEIEERRRNAS